ncbi:MAG TPA: hypothetical protein VGG62_14900 [Terracidiphilus sp.]|jgi:hypothetical protein
MKDELIHASAGSNVGVKDAGLSDEITISSDTSPAAAAAAAKAEVEAAFVLAWRKPRDIDLFRERVLKDCRRPLFAETALYHRPVGREKDPATGEWRDAFAVNFSVRFIESALQHWMHVNVSARITYEDRQRALMTVKVLDLERNVAYSTDAMMDKVVERREIKKGRVAIGVRENSYGDTVYLVEATKDEFRNVLGAERSKLIRDNGQRLLPRDILEEARMVIDATVSSETAKDPDGAKKKVLDKFSSLGISAAMLKEYLGPDKPIESLTLEGLNNLGALYNGLKEGSFTWPDVMRMKLEQAEGDKSDKGQKPGPGGARKLRERMLENPQAPPLPLTNEEPKS